MITETKIAKIRAIEDTWDRASEAQAALRLTEPLEKATRARRDVAALVLVAPYANAAQESNEYRAEAKAEHDGYWAKTDGEKVATTKQSAAHYVKANPGVKVVYHKPSITQAEYLERLEIARKMRDAAFTAAKARGELIMEPAKVYTALGMHRNLLVRLMKRKSTNLPDLPNAMEEGQKARDELIPLTKVATELREIRDGAIEVLIADAIPSVDIASHLGITPARVTQIRQGSHR